MDNNDSREVAEIIENAMREFNESMYHREQLSIRIGRRTTQIIRFGMIGLLALGLALFYLIFILAKDFSAITEHMDDMSGYMSTMDRNFVVVAETLPRMHTTLDGLNRNITVMPALNQSVGNMDTSLGALSTDMHTMVEQLNRMNASVANMTTSMHVLNTQFTDMNRIVGHMSGDVNQMSKPMRAFPFP
ncbi:MAG: hypothetical protein WBN57_07990 [Gammaproteobacteria bacterium]